MRRIVYYVAASADGFIARLDGSVDWLETRAAGDYGAATFFAGVDTIVWGRRTWDEAQPRGGIAPFGDRTEHVVVTHRPAPPQPRVVFTNEPVDALAARLRQRPGKAIWVMGGAQLAGAFLDAGVLDEVVVHQIPVLLGDGIPLFSRSTRDVPLHLAESHAFPDGVVRLTYAPAGRAGAASVK